MRGNSESFINRSNDAVLLFWAKRSSEKVGREHGVLKKYDIGRNGDFLSKLYLWAGPRLRKSAHRTHKSSFWFSNTTT